MYDETSFKNYIFWLQVKRVFLMIVFSLVGAFIGILLSQFLIDVLTVLAAGFKVVIIAISTLLFFGISLLLTAGTGKEVQDGYWKMAVLRKLTVISKKLDYLENIDNAPDEKKAIVKKVAKDLKEDLPENSDLESLSIEDDDFSENEKEIKKDFAGNVVEDNKPTKSKKKSATKKQINKMKKK